MADARITPDRRREVAARARDTCEYCRSQGMYSPDPFSVEHVVPSSRGGTDDLGNLAWSCQGCNNHKSTRVDGPDPLTGERAPLFHPRRHLWAEHFAWDAEFVTVIGLTATGRVTVEHLALNRSSVVNLRRLLRLIGAHPPPDLP